MPMLMMRLTAQTTAHYTATVLSSMTLRNYAQNVTLVTI